MNLSLMGAIKVLKPWSREDFSNDCQYFELEHGGRVICVVLDWRYHQIRFMQAPCSEICLHISVVSDVCCSQLEKNVESVPSVSQYEGLW